MADDIRLSPLVPPAATDRVQGVGQRHTSLNQHAFAKQLQRNEEGESSEEGEGSPERSADDREDGRAAMQVDSDSEAFPGEEDEEAPRRLVDVVV